MKPRPIPGLARALLLSSTLLVCFTAHAGGETLKMTQPEREQLGVRVKEIRASATASVGQLSLRATFALDSQRVVKSPLPGSVERIFVQEGARVRTGDPLVTIRSSAMVDLQQAFLSARAAEHMQRGQWQRDRKLREAGSISEKRWQETKFAYESARAEAAGLRGQLLVAGMAADDIDSLDSRADVSPDFVLRTPMDGVVVTREAELGERVDGSGILVRLGAPDHLVLEGILSSSAAAGTREGAGIVQLGGPGRGRIAWVSSVIDPASQTVRMRAEPDDAAGLVPGELTRWSILPEGDVLLLPSSSVVQLAGADTVFVEAPGGFEVREVQVARAGDSWRVLTGIAAGEAVAVTGTAVLKGMALGMGGGD